MKIVLYPLAGALIGLLGAAVLGYSSLAAAILLSIGSGPRKPLILAALSLVVRWLALEHIDTRAFEALAASLALAWTAPVVLAWVTPPLGDRNARVLANSLSTPMAIAAIAVAVACAAPLLIYSLPLIIGAAAITSFARTYCWNRMGGVTDDCLARLKLAVEIYGLGVCACFF